MLSVKWCIRGKILVNLDVTFLLWPLWSANHVTHKNKLPFGRASTIVPPSKSLRSLILPISTLSRALWQMLLCLIFTTVMWNMYNTDVEMGGLHDKPKTLCQYAVYDIHDMTCLMTNTYHTIEESEKTLKSLTSKGNVS